MSEIKVNTGSMNTVASLEQDYAKQMQRFMSEISDVKRSLGFKVKSRAKIDSQLQTMINVSEKNVNRLNKLSTTLSNAAGSYVDTEKRIVDHVPTGLGVKSIIEIIANLINGLPRHMPTGYVPFILPNLINIGVLVVGPVVFGTPTGQSWADKMKNSVALLSGSASTGGTFLGHKYGLTAEGDLLGATTSGKAGAKWAPSKGEAGFEYSGTAEAHLVHGKVTGNYGILKAEREVTVGQVSATGGVGASLFKDGKFSPQLKANAKVEAKGVTVSGTNTIGNDKFNAHAKSEGTIGKASAEVGGELGKISYTDKNGVSHSGYGAHGKAGAEACVFEGKASGGFNLFGIKFDVGVSGKALSVGATAEGSVTTGGVSGKIGGSLGIGGGLEFNIDWSNFKLF